MGEEAVGEGEVVSGALDKATHDDGGHGERRCAESSIAWRVAWLVVEVLPPAPGVFHFVSRPL